MANTIDDALEFAQNMGEQFLKIVHGGKYEPLILLTILSQNR
jgi:hypothetical protein